VSVSDKTVESDSDVRICALCSLCTRVCHFSMMSRKMSCDDTLVAMMSQMPWIGTCHASDACYSVISR